MDPFDEYSDDELWDALEQVGELSGDVLRSLCNVMIPIGGVQNINN